MKRNASEFASSATQPHLVPTLRPQLMVPTLCSQHRFHLRRTPVPPLAPNLWPQLSQLSGSNSVAPPPADSQRSPGPNSMLRTLWSQLSGPSSLAPPPTDSPCTPGPDPLVPTPGPNSLVPTLRSELCGPTSGRLPTLPRSQLSGPNSLVTTLWPQLSGHNSLL